MYVTLRLAVPDTIGTRVARSLDTIHRSPRALELMLDLIDVYSCEVAEVCCDSHNRRCEPPSELCCRGCTERADDAFPIRHPDGSRCVMDSAPYAAIQRPVNTTTEPHGPCLPGCILSVPHSLPCLTADSESFQAKITRDHTALGGHG